MTKKEFLQHLDEVLELPNGTLQGVESLEDIGAWDSMAAVDFLALADERFGLIVPPQKLAECRTVDDLVHLVEDGISE